MNQDYYDEQYDNWDEYDDYDEDDYEHYDNDYEYFGYNYYDGNEYIPTRWQRVKAWFNRMYWNIRYKLQPNLHDDIPF